MPCLALQFLLSLFCYQIIERDCRISCGLEFCQAQIKCGLFSSHRHLVCLTVAIYYLDNSIDGNLLFYFQGGMCLCLKRYARYSHGEASTLVLLPLPSLPSSLQVEAIFADVVEVYFYYTICLHLSKKRDYGSMMQFNEISQIGERAVRADTSAVGAIMHIDYFMRTSAYPTGPINRPLRMSGLFCSFASLRPYIFPWQTEH